MSRSLLDLEPQTQAKARALLLRVQKVGLIVAVYSTLRTYEEQAKLYAQGRTAPGEIVTKARPGQSWHNFGRAFDVAFVSPATGKLSWRPDYPWTKLGEMGEAVGLTWGGRWKRFPDLGHFQWEGGLTLARARVEYERGHPEVIA